MGLTPGQTIGPGNRYTVEAAIGEGGMGAVYRAFDAKLRRKVALKVIHPDVDVPDAAARLVREAHAAAQLTHPNTVAIHDLGELDDTVFLVMELVEGEPLRAYVGDASVPVRTKLGWLADAARGLAAAHDTGLVHRDVKPSNIMVARTGRVKVLDFGLAKPVEASSLGGGKVVVGTPRYMAPELFRGMPADARSDEYAFGVTAYELITGVHPGGPAAAVPPALDSVTPEAGPEAARVVGRMLARDRADRFGDLHAVASALEAAAAKTGDATTSTPPTRREGMSAAPLAMAKTELAASDPAPSFPTPTLRASLEAPATSSGARTFGVVAIALALGAGGAWVARRGGDAVAGIDVADGAAAPLADALDASTDAAIATDASPGIEDAALPFGEPDASEVPDASDDAALPLPAPTIVVDDFPDPWLAAHPPGDAGRTP